eukprot:scpid99770/ scgid22742/ 
MAGSRWVEVFRRHDNPNAEALHMYHHLLSPPSGALHTSVGKTVCRQCAVVLRKECDHYSLVFSSLPVSTSPYNVLSSLAQCQNNPHNNIIPLYKVSSFDRSQRPDHL